MMVGAMFMFKYALPRTNLNPAHLFLLKLMFSSLLIWWSIVWTVQGWKKAVEIGQYGGDGGRG